MTWEAGRSKSTYLDGYRIAVCTARWGPRACNTSLCRRLIRKSCKGFLLPEYRQHVEDAGGGGAARQRPSKGLRNRPKLKIVGLGEGPQCRFGGLGRPGRDCLQSRAQAPDQFPVLRGEQRRRLWLDLERSIGENEVCVVDQLDERLRTLLQTRHCLQQLSAGGIVKLRLELSRARNIVQHALEHGYERLIVGMAKVMAVQAFQFGEVEAGGRPAYARQVESGDHLLGRKYFLVAVAPSKPYEVIAERGGQISHCAISIDAERAMAFRKL